MIIPIFPPKFPTFKETPKDGGEVCLVAPEGGPVLVLQGGGFVEEDIAERVFGVADDDRPLGDAADVVGDVGDGDDDEDGNLPRRQVAPERVDRHRQE